MPVAVFRPTCFLFCLVFLFPLALRAFQLADGAPPSSTGAGRYIFYWDSQQCDLSESNGYSGTIVQTPAGFRQMLLRTPYLWNGKNMADQIVFRLQGIVVTASRNGSDYHAQIGRLDELLGKTAQAGQTISLSDLQLDNGRTGQISIVLNDPEEKDSPDRVVRGIRVPPPNAPNSGLVETVVWGREDILENSNRDFFSVAEFWQTIEQFPYVEWKAYVEPRQLQGSIGIRDPDQVSMGFSLTLEPEIYRNTLGQIKNYQHLIKPGSTITLTLQTAQYDPVYTKTMTLVADDDARLTLRRTRDTHTLQIRWGNWSQQVEGLYLLDRSDARDFAVPADFPLFLNNAVFAQADWEAVLTRRPEFRVDGVALPDVSFRLRLGENEYRIDPGQPLPDSLGAGLTPDPRRGLEIRLDSMQAPGYNLPPLTIVLSYLSLRNPLLVANTLQALQALPASEKIVLDAPKHTPAEYTVDFQIPEKAFVRLSVFEPDGWKTFVLEDTYPAGKHTARIPRSAFRNTGKHFLFVHTPDGVARREFYVE